MLPIESALPELFEKLNHHDKVILQAPPGAGKSTHLPLIMLKQNCFSGKIIMLEPRRLAARSIAYYIAEQLGEPVGQSVGYRIRQESKVSSQTRLEIVTEGVLTRLIQSDPELTAISCIIFDEFHERSIHADLALALSLEVQVALRDDLKLLIMSATLDSDYLAELLDAPVVTSEGRSYPVDIEYVPCKNTEVIAKVGPLALKLLNEQTGSMLVFLPGAKEISAVEAYLKEQTLPNHVKVYPLYGDLDKKDQQAAISPCKEGERKVVLATNIAETSLTIDGIRLVIDSGLKRHAGFNVKNGVSRLTTVNISKSSATQRAGRAGRLMPGICYRFDSPEQFARRRDFDEPEILTSDLMSLVLEVANWGAQIDQLQWVSQPPKHLAEQATGLLQQLEILDNDAKVTPLGNQIIALGVHPRVGHMLLKAKALEDKLEQPVAALACYLAAIIEEADPLPKAMRAGNCNIEARVRWVAAGKNQLIAKQAKAWARKIAVQLHGDIPLHFCGLLLALAFPDRIARSRGQGFQLSNGFGVVIDSDDPLSHEPLLVVADLIEFNQNTFVSQAAMLALDDLTEFLPYLLSRETFVGWDDKGQKLLAESQLKLGKIILERKPEQGAITQEQRITAFIHLIKTKGLGLLKFDGAAQQLQLRMILAHQVGGEQWPNCSDEALLDTLDIWLAPYLNNVQTVAQLKSLNLNEPLMSLLDWPQQQQLAQDFPERFKVPTGNQHKIEYRQDLAPKLSVRIQEMFGLTQTPTLAGGKVPLVIELLSPAQRPLQLTQDLAGFWTGSYEQVKKEMKGRYPKHNWDLPDIHSKVDSKIDTSKKKG